MTKRKKRRKRSRAKWIPSSTIAPHQPQHPRLNKCMFLAVFLHLWLISKKISRNAANNGTPNSTNRRRPGRPKGSKNKKPRFDVPGTSPPKPAFTPNPPFYGYAPPPPPGGVPMQPHPPPHPVVIPTFAPEPNTQQFFDFQWRVLTLCSEFYNAADELIVRRLFQSYVLSAEKVGKQRGAPPHIVAQCFNVPGNQVDPISILHEARRACDQLVRISPWLHAPAT